VSHTPRLGLALEDAVVRQAVRDVCAASGRSELVLTSITGTGLVARASSAKLTHVVIGASLVDAPRALSSLRETGDIEVYVATHDTVDTVQRLGVPPTRIIEVHGDPQTVAKQIVGALSRRPATRPPRHGPRPTPEPSADTSTPPQPPAHPPAGTRPALLAIGSSTGGPEALSTLLADFPADFPAPIVIVQHMPPDFTAVLAKTLDRVSPMRVSEVTEPTVALPGEVWIAPGHRHLLVTSPTGQLELDDGPEIKNCRPSVDILFASVARSYGPRALATVLTGMGDDGVDGAADLVAAGARVVVQDEASSVVWGMPGAIVRRGLAHEILPLRHLASALQAPFLTRTPARRTSPLPTKECPS
jgi:two-component system chemotaxis response regulator CheB